MSEKPFRILPLVNDENRHFWEGGARGELCFLCCEACSYYVHPPAPVCPECLGRELAPRAVSGRGVVHAYTVNHQPWIPGFDPPYVVAIVEIDEQPGLRLTTNVTGCEIDAVSIGMPVEVRFEEIADDVYLPLFEPAADSPPPGSAASQPSAPARSRPPMLAGLEGKAALTGIGQSQVGRRLNRDPMELTIDACLEAIADAGLRREDIDGISTYPGNGIAGAPGFTGAGVVEVQDALRLELNWFCGGPELPGQLGSVINACAAVATGLARHVLCFRTVWESTAQGGGRRAGIGTGGGGRFRASGNMQWTLPFGAASAAVWIAMMARRHFHEYGTTREQMAQIALNARRNAALNPKAIYRDPMSLDDYMKVRMISSPFCLYDCDAPVDGSTAMIVSAVDAAKDLRRPPLRVEAVGSAIHGRPSWDQWDDLTTMALRDAGAMLWRRTDLRPGDVDVAELYDGFSFITMAWLEALGGGLRRRRQAHRPRRGAAPQHPRWAALRRPPPRLRLSSRGLRAALGRGRGAPGGRESAGRRRGGGRRASRRLPAPFATLRSRFRPAGRVLGVAAAAFLHPGGEIPARIARHLLAIARHSTYR
jgi:acetyl-CoA acetyltransferase/uncharacterized OB-fold protein